MNKKKKKIKSKKRKKINDSNKSYKKHQKIINKCEKILKNKKPIDDYYDNLFKKILENTHNLWIPDKKKKQKDKFKNDNNATEYTSHSWFNITEYNGPESNKLYNVNIPVPKMDIIMRCDKIKMYPNSHQKQLLLNWMKSYIKMYNETIKLFKKCNLNNIRLSLDWKKVRTNYLKDVKEKIIDKSDMNITDEKGKKINTKINGHVLDGAIQDACAKYKSCLTNLKNGNIKYFRLRYLKQSKDTMVMKIEKNFINKNKNTFCSTVFNEAIKLHHNFQLKNIHCDFTIHYNRKLDEFQLLNPIKTKQETNNDNKNSAGVDPGLRSFVTVFSNGKCVKIGDNLIKKVLKYTEKIDKLNNKDCNKRPKIQKKLLRKYYKTINNLIDDLHWKTINYLTSNFNDILIGNLSTKRIISKELNNELDDDLKRVASHMGLYKFRQRLEYKCQQKSVGYSIINEAYTTMTCTKCCYKNDVYRKKVINCQFCKLKIDRDFNGARNILLHGID